jgi:hypothetical protein
MRKGREEGEMGERTEIWGGGRKGKERRLKQKEGSRRKVCLRGRSMRRGRGQGRRWEQIGVRLGNG